MGPDCARVETAGIFWRLTGCVPTNTHVATLAGLPIYWVSVLRHYVVTAVVLLPLLQEAGVMKGCNIDSLIDNMCSIQNLLCAPQSQHAGVGPLKLASKRNLSRLRSPFTKQAGNETTAASAI
jgi:hypothetical protein